jgi:hypothetical protein
MARNFFGLEKGVDIYAENGALQARILTGSAAPDGLGDQGTAPIGSLYIRTNGELYQKVANAGNSSDYLLNGSSNASVGTWRGESLVLVTNDTQGAGVRDVVASPFADDDGTAVPLAAYVVGKYIISDADGTPALLEITNVAGNNVTFAAAGSPLAQDDTFICQYYLPDVPDSQEQQAIVNYNGSVVLKIGDINWNFADGINMAAGYSAQNGSISSSDSVNSAVEKLDGNQQDLITLSGVAQGAVNLGSFTGATIPDSQTVKQALQSLETAYEETDQNVDDLISLSGVAENAVNLGSFTGDIIADNQTVKAALQDLETELVDTRQNTDDLISLSGVAENSSNLGAFSSPGSFLLTATETIKSALQKLADYLFGVKVTQTTGVQALTTVDSLAHASYKRVQWIVEVFETATPANREGFTIDALTDGTSVDDTKYSKLKLGANIGASAVVAISGANLLLQVSATPSCTVNVRRLTVV